ncbi:amino acid adenylation domain-containing protein [Marinivivus vitaminiproducens]|uniref:amino acid adenylation domain-containing protein n=1 Tax=Marinivivus vitaminiproducens TaxID=3035935 RepID=UPI0027A953BA|nr:amino acid adenylation domain-containing protein [Geminicoccaceae bacterium SCSIO 64248]
MPGQPMSASIQDVYPLTSTQQGMLFHSLSAPGHGLYVVQIAFTLAGAMDDEAEDRAWRALVQRHDVLRTAFAWENQRAPLQVVGTSAAPRLGRIDLAGLREAEQDSAIDSFLAEDRAAGFDLRRAPLFRATRFILSPFRRRVVLTFHHIILDGWSVGLLLRDWMALHRGEVLPPAPAFRDHVAWLAGQDAAAAARFWREELAGIETTTALPLSPAAPDAMPGRGAVALHLDPALSSRLRGLTRERRLTVGTLVHGAWALLLARYSGDDEVVYGLTRSGRPAELPEAETRVGMFINTLPMRARVEPDRPAIDWLLDLQERQQRQQTHEHAALVAVQDATSIPAGEPLMRSVVVFENYPMDAGLRQSGAGVAVEDVAIAEQTSFPLSLFAVMREALEISVLYERSAFAPAAMTRLAGHLRVLLEALADDPARRIADLPILTCDERDRLIRADAPAPTPVPVTSAPAKVAALAGTRPDATAVIAGERALDYATLDRRIDAVAQRLRRQGVAPGAAVGLCLARGIDLAVALLAVLRAGCHYVPLDPGYPPARLAYYLEDSGARTVIGHTPTASLCRSLGATLLDLDAPPDTSGPDAADATPSDLDPAGLAYLIYTSGSTGTPKGVRIPHRALNNLLAAFARRLESGPGDRFLALTTLSFDIAILEMLLPLTTGGTLVLPTDDDIRDPARIAALIERHSATHVQATPATWRLLVEAGWQGSGALTALCGGEALDAPLARALMERTGALWNVYGPTETTVWSTALRLRPELAERDTVPIGGPIDNTRLYVLDARQRLVPTGVPGELWIGGQGLCDGYHNRPALDAERFVDDPFRAAGTEAPPARLYRTGDRVRRREDGHLDFLGRIDGQAKLRGHRLELGEVEAALAAHPTVAQAVVVIEGERASARLVAYLRTAPEADMDEMELRRRLAATLPPVMVPSSYVLLNAIPLTPNGKIDRKALATAGGTSLASPPTSAAPPVLAEPAASLAEIWRQALGVERIGLQDHFFERGGHSLLVIGVRDAIRQRLGVALEAVDIFRFPTLQALADHVAALSQGREERALPDRTQARAAGQARLRQRARQNHQPATSEHV